jgi:hypothetical protein
MRFSNWRLAPVWTLVALVLAFASAGWGQGTYYREVAKDGKVYVFNRADRFAAFERGTPLSDPIERLGWGAKGETVVFDSVEALNLFAFKHDKAPEAPQPATEPPKPADKPWFEKVKVSGYVFGDAYYVADHHDPAIEGQNGFWIRRGYLTFDFAISEKWSARFREEVNSPGDFAATSTKLQPFVKDAYLAWKHQGRELYLGISPSPTWEFIEGFWGYRAVEKTPLDLFRMGSSRDFGLAFKGKAAGGKVSYHAMLGNGAGEGSETNEGKKAMLAIGFKPSDALVVELYGDTEDRPGATDRTTYQGFLGWQGEKGRAGVLYASQDRQRATGPDQTLAVGSIFGVWDLSERYHLLARFDRAFDGNPEADRIPYLVLAKKLELDLAMIGLDVRLQKKISLIPNVEWVTYRETDGQPAASDDVIAKLTLYFQF